MGWLFAIGSACFAMGSLPLYFNWAGPAPTAATFFVGSLFFTSAGYIQYYLSLNGEGSTRRFFGYDRDNPDIVASAIQSIGTLFFNVTTFAATISNLTLQQENRLIWGPDAFGSIAFLISSWIAFKLVRPKVKNATKRQGREWWIGAVNYWGSIAFGVSAVASIFLPTTGEPLNIALVNAGTFLGACGFFTGAILGLGLEDASADSELAGT
jgi:hypothetical protein